MPRPTPVPPCNRRFANDTPALGAPVPVSDRSINRTASEQTDVESSSVFDLPEIRTLDGASVDACFKDLSDLLADIC